MKLSPDAVALEAAKQWAMEEKIPTANCSVIFNEAGDLEVQVQDSVATTISKREFEQFPALIPQFVWERLTRAYRKVKAAGGNS